MKSYLKTNKINIKNIKKNIGDKSISHRSIICCLLKNNLLEINNFLESFDILSTLNLFKSIGLYIYGPIKNYLVISSYKKNNKNKYINFIGNSGTSIRISLSLLMENNIILGDKSLNKRTMYRIIKPLTLLGYIIQCKKNFFTPIIIYKKNNFGLKYNLINISSQIKSCLLLSSLNSYLKIYIKEKKKTRDHSERFLFNFKNKKKNFLINIPNDISSLSFIIGYYLLKKKKFFLIINLNKLRIGIFEYLLKSGLKIFFIYKKIINNEHKAKIFFYKYNIRKNILFSNDISKMIDEIPVLLIILINKNVKSKIYGLEELKYKESNRLSSMYYNIIKVGIRILSKKNYLIIKGNKKHGNFITTFNDHRLFMSFYIDNAKNKISNIENILSSFPNFLEKFNNKYNNYYVYNK